MQDGEIVRPVFIEISVVRQLLPADNVDLHACLVRGLHLILEVPQLQYRAVGGEVAERIGELQLRHAHVGDRVLDRARALHIVGHCAGFEFLYTCGDIGVHGSVDRVVLLIQPVDPADILSALGVDVAAIEVIANAQIQRAVVLLQQKDEVRCGLGVPIVEIIRQPHAPRGLVVAAQGGHVREKGSFEVFIRQRDPLHRREGQ